MWRANRLSAVEGPPHLLASREDLHCTLPERPVDQDLLGKISRFLLSASGHVAGQPLANDDLKSDDGMA
jgi:hypothetical protein